LPAATEPDTAGYEVKNPGASQEVSKYYFAGASRIAVRKYTVPVSMALEYTLADHLGSASITTDKDGVKVSEIRYKPWGEVRYSSSVLPTRYTFTGQYSYVGDAATGLGNNGFGLMFYNARWLDNSIGRFTQPDTAVAGGVQGYDRYAYVSNNPVRYNDPTGHDCSDPEDPTPTCDSGNNGGGITPPPPPEDPVELTTGKDFCRTDDYGTRCYNGTMMSDLYNYYLNTKGWWNGGLLNNFSYEKFLGLMMMYEMGSATGAEEYLIQAAALQIWGDSSGTGGHQPYCTSVCINGMFNFLAIYSQSAQKRYDEIFRNAPPGYDPQLDFAYDPNLTPGVWNQQVLSEHLKYFNEKASSIGSSILNVDANSELRVYTNNKPYHWGNYGGNYDAIYHSGNFYVFSANQRALVGESPLPIP
jgi:RHS repeat-associated protein